MAFQFINVIRRMLGEGALNTALVPAWMRLRDGSGLAAASAFAGNVLATVSATLIATTPNLPPKPDVPAIHPYF